MAKIINFQNQSDTYINVNQLKTNTRKVAAGLLSPAQETITETLAPEHTSEPIKSLDDIERISKFLINAKRYRDNMLFIVGINFGLRISDLRMLRFSNLINDNLTFKDTFPVFEKKTRNTRKRKRNRYITINDAVIEAVTLYLQNTPNVSLSDYMFRSLSNNGSNVNEPIAPQTVNTILKGIKRDLGLDIKMSSHSLRKTFCYWIMVQGNNDPRRLLLLQKMLGHSSPIQTLAYIGLDAEEISAAYRELNIGLHNNRYFVDTAIYEREIV